MTIARRLKWVLDSREVDYEIVPHAPTWTAAASARSARVPAGRVAKCVLVEDERGYVLAVVPASCRLSLEALDQALGRHLELAGESEIEDIYRDCERGAVPPIGATHEIPIAVDDSLLRLPDVYFEAGDHEALVHVTGEAFKDLIIGSAHGRFGSVH
jgi:Ala-tRNA(Pro) deacylase